MLSFATEVKKITIRYLQIIASRMEIGKTKADVAEDIFQQYKDSIAAYQANNQLVSVSVGGRCSHNLAQILLQADNGDYGTKYMGCIKNEERLRDFAYYMAFR